MSGNTIKCPDCEWKAQFKSNPRMKKLAQRLFEKHRKENH